MLPAMDLRRFKTPDARHGPTSRGYRGDDFISKKDQAFDNLAAAFKRNHASATSPSSTVSPGNGANTGSLGPFWTSENR